ncbi:MAG: hypothetical protein GC150_11380 [Rhizobiales bacterium]|nr:hypothetical protein [Hyphomicrobiales bacterium]
MRRKRGWLAIVALTTVFGALLTAGPGAPIDRAHAATVADCRAMITTGATLLGRINRITNKLRTTTDLNIRTQLIADRWRYYSEYQLLQQGYVRGGCVQLTGKVEDRFPSPKPFSERP